MPPELLSDALAEPTVMRSFACCTVRVPRPETAKRRKACLVGELSGHRGEGDRGRYHVEGDGRRGRRAVPVGGGDAERVGADREARDDDRAPRPEGAVAARAPADGGGEVAVLGVGRGGGEEHGLPGE